MKMKVLPLAVGAASAVAMSAAHAAMYVNERGTGETLIFPFYSAENGNNTLVNIANTTTDTKAVKVRILEAQNSQEVLDFNLYLSPEDHFSFAIAATDEGGAKLVTGDNSCTVPAIPADGVAFRNLKYAGDKLETKDDPKTDADESKNNFNNTGIGRTQVGYIEVIEMGQIDPKSAVIIDKTPKSATYTPKNAAAAIKHGADGVPADCSILVDAWSTIKGVDGVWLAESKTTDLTGDSEFMAAWQGGGLYGYATVINVPQGAAFGYDAVAINDHVAAGATGSDMHYQPGDIRPNFGDSAMNTSAIINVNGQAVTLDFNGDYPDEAVERVQALNATMMSTEVYNDYVTDPAIAATTDWLFTFPTKAFHVNEKVVAVEPFSALWTGKSACEPSELSALDREESTPPPPPAPGSSGPDFSPAPPTPPGTPPAGDDVPLCYEATIMQFAEESAAGTSTVAVGVNAYLDANDGWATVSFSPDDIDSDLAACVEAKGATVAPLIACDRTIDAGDATLTGLPVLGFAVQKYVNGSAGGAGVLANYAMASSHKSCAVGSGTAANEC